jgi:hypothetical protein
MFRTATVAQITAAAEALAAQVAHLGITVVPNAYGHRASCACGWSKCHGTVGAMREHAASHA